MSLSRLDLGVVLNRQIRRRAFIDDVLVNYLIARLYLYGEKRSSY